MDGRCSVSPSPFVKSASRPGSLAPRPMQGAIPSCKNPGLCFDFSFLHHWPLMLASFCRCPARYEVKASQGPVLHTCQVHTGTLSVCPRNRPGRSASDREVWLSFKVPSAAPSTPKPRLSEGQVSTRLSIITQQLSVGHRPSSSSHRPSSSSHRPSSSSHRPSSSSRRPCHIPCHYSDISTAASVQGLGDSLH